MKLLDALVAQLLQSGTRVQLKPNYIQSCHIKQDYPVVRQYSVGITHSTAMAELIDS